MTNGAPATNGVPSPKHSLNGTGNDINGTASRRRSLSMPTQFIACVRTAASAERLRRSLDPTQLVAVVHGENALAVREADFVLLGCQPGDLATCVGVPTTAAALRGKVLVSILAGVTAPQIEAVLRQAEDEAEDAANGDRSGSAPCEIVRAMPNTASFVRASTTVVTAGPGASAAALCFVDWLFGAVGSVQHIPQTAFDTCTALCGSTPAFFALFLEALVDGAVNLGLRRAEAQDMAAQTMKGTAALILNGEHPAVLREKVTTPGGSTSKGLFRLEEGRLRAVVAGALMHCKRAAEELGDDK